MSFPVRLVLFDVDGTILSARGAGRRAFGAALMEVYGTAGDIERYDLRGATDQRIVFELMEGAGLSRDGVRERLDDCFAAYARGLGRGFRPEEILVIGDTPRDIECARHFGAVAVAVATGQYSRAELEAEGPDLLFEDFSDVDAALAKLLSR